MKVSPGYPVGPLSAKTQELLDKLISDYLSALEIKRPITCKDVSALIYNLFRGKYDFSAKMYNELFMYLKYEVK